MYSKNVRIWYLLQARFLAYKCQYIVVWCKVWPGSSFNFFSFIIHANCMEQNILLKKQSNEIFNLQFFL